MITCWYDLETWNETPLSLGHFKYSETVEIMIFAYAFDDGPVQIWDLTTEPEAMPSDLYEALTNPEYIFTAHNQQFDATMMREYFPWLDFPIEKTRCMMARALAHGLPGSLDTLGEIFEILEDLRKHKEGKDLVRLFCMPRPKTSKLRRATKETHPEQWKRFLAYAGNDIEAMRALDKKIPVWNYRGEELDLWHLDQKINARGILVDLDLAHSAIAAAKRAQDLHAERTQVLTNDEVQAATQRDKLLKHILDEHGVSLPDMQTSTLERRLADENLPDVVRELIAIRLEASMTSPKKYQRVVDSTSRDGRLRGLLQFCGASRTGRWAGRLVQPQNLPRPTMKQSQIEIGIEAIKAGAEDLLFANVMKLCSSAIRGVFISSPGKKMVVSDLSNIEGRMLAWFAEEEWKIKAFSDFDMGIGEDMYKLAYARSFSVDVTTVTKDLRQIGKVQELALGYGGGVGAFVTFALAYSIDLDELAATALPTIPQDVLDEAAGMWDWAVKKKKTFGLPRLTFIVCDSLKRLWRRAHPETESFWHGLENNVRQAILNRGTVIDYKRLKIAADADWLRIQLPSGRALCYAKPLIKDGAITYMGINQYSRKWQRLSTYGGKLVENVIQAASRDQFAYTMPIAEEAGYELLLLVHDEDITEAPDTPEFNSEALGAIMSMNAPWATGLPLAAGGFETYRYRKE